jgi:hypothetical protein
MKLVLGMEVEYGQGWCLLRQQSNIKHMMEEYMVNDLVNWDPTVPIRQEDLDKLVKHDAPQSTLPYRNLIGELMWITHTRVDIMHAVRRLSSYANAYDDYAYWLGLIVVKFIHCTREYGVRIVQSEAARTGSPLKAPLEIYSYTDASHASISGDMRSISGAVTFLQGNPVLISCQIQKTVATSSTESELVAATEAAKDVRHVQILIGELGPEINTPSRIHVDSQGAGFIASNDKNSSRTRHVEIKHFFCRELVAALFVVFGYVPGTDNVADMFTKALERIKYAEYAGVLMSTLSDMRSWWKQ